MIRVSQALQKRKDVSWRRWATWKTRHKRHLRKCRENSSACVWGSSEHNQRRFEAVQGGHSARANGSVWHEELYFSRRNWTLSLESFSPKNNMVSLLNPYYSGNLPSVDFHLFLKRKRSSKVSVLTLLLRSGTNRSRTFISYLLIFWIKNIWL